MFYSYYQGPQKRGRVGPGKQRPVENFNLKWIFSFWNFEKNPFMYKLIFYDLYFIILYNIIRIILIFKMRINHWLNTYLEIMVYETTVLLHACIIGCILLLKVLNRAPPTPKKKTKTKQQYSGLVISDVLYRE